VALETPIWLQGGTYSARLDRSLLDVIFTEGVIDPGSNALQVTERAAGANDTVDVAAGAAIITGDDEANQGKYYVRNTAVVNVAFTPAPGSDERIDLLVLQVNDPTAGGSAGNNAVFEVVEGTVAGTAVAPAVPDTAIPLAEVLRLSTDTTIVNARITDRRPTSSTASYTVRSQFEILTTTERNALTPFEGQVIFNSTDDIVQYYDGSVWVDIAPPPSPIGLILALGG
jgi:alkanesulfonate monooxygenase SsuD/methylene tetrahydromethanopterin reductase-like flavin-dependent oxidoreductase (luciferase family)